MKKKYSLRTYGKLTEENCPICLEVKLRFFRNKLNCPVCNYKRDVFYDLNLLGLSKFLINKDSTIEKK